MSKRACLSAFGLLLLTACNGAADPSTDDGTSSSEGSVESGLSRSASCDQSQLFVKQGLAQDMRDTLDAAFLTDDQIRVPGALIAYDSYGGDMIETVLGASATAERVFAVSPGGAFSGQIGGAPSGTKFQKRAFTAGKALFDAMTKATETSSTDQGWTTTVRTSKGGRFTCQVRTQGSAVHDSSCAFRDLLMFHASSWPRSATQFCVP